MNRIVKSTLNKNVSLFIELTIDLLSQVTYH